MQAVGNSYLEAYAPILEKRKNTPFTEKELFFQQYRRGRYAEFNLVIDRGTIFGLQSGAGRIESAFLCPCPQVRWIYVTGTHRSAEEKLYTDYLKPREWVELPDNKLTQEPSVDRYAVMGNPIGHSLSPHMHRAFAEQTGQSMFYEAMLVKPDEFSQEVSRFLPRAAKV